MRVGTELRAVAEQSGRGGDGIAGEKRHPCRHRDHARGEEPHAVGGHGAEKDRALPVRGVPSVAG